MSLWTKAWYQDVYLASEHWQKTRLAKLRKNPICQRCKKQWATDVHHKHYNTVYKEDLERDLLALDRYCHYDEHVAKNWKQMRPSYIFRKIGNLFGLIG